MSDTHLSQLGLPFGQRVRILKEVELLQPLDAGDVIWETPLSNHTLSYVAWV